MKEQLLELAEHHEMNAQRVFMELEGLNLWMKNKETTPSQEDCKKFMKEYTTRMVAKHKKWAKFLRGLYANKTSP